MEFMSQGYYGRWCEQKQICNICKSEMASCIRNKSNSEQSLDEGSDKTVDLGGMEDGDRD